MLSKLWSPVHSVAFLDWSQVASAYLWVSFIPIRWCWYF